MFVGGQFSNYKELSSGLEFCKYLSIKDFTRSSGEYRPYEISTVHISQQLSYIKPRRRRPSPSASADILIPFFCYRRL